MMPVAYSMDLRIRVQQELAKKALCMRELAEKYSISISTLHSWRRLLAKKGTMQPKQRAYSGRRPKFFHPEPILACLQDNPDYRVQELADHFDLKYSTMYSYLQRFKIKLKKKFTPTKKPALNNESFS
jgi:hypothetical protein